MKQRRQLSAQRQRASPLAIRPLRGRRVAKPAGKGTAAGSLPRFSALLGQGL